MRVKRAAVAFFMWGGPLVALLLVAAWWLSGTRWLAYLGPGDWQFSAGGGLVGVSYWPGRTEQTERITGVAPPRGLQSITIQPSFAWWFRADWQPDRRSFAMPFWFPIVIVAGMSAAAWRKDLLTRRHARLGHCAKCHYDRKGLDAAAPCPECGTMGIIQ